MLHPNCGVLHPNNVGPRRDKVPHPGSSIAWGRWAITSNDPSFRGQGAPDSGEDYGPAPGGQRRRPACCVVCVGWRAAAAASCCHVCVRPERLKPWAPLPHLPPDLDHTNLVVRDGLVDWLNWLRSHIGFEGWRFDFVKVRSAQLLEQMEMRV